MPDYSFFKFTREDILRGLIYILDQKKMNEAVAQGDPALAFVYDRGLQKLASYWLDSDQDFNLMLLKYATEVDYIVTQRGW